MSIFKTPFNLISKLTLIILLFGLGTSCTSPKRLLNNGQYDQAVYKACKKLSRNKTKEKHVRVLEVAFQKALERDDERIKALKAEGKPDGWDDVFAIYSQMKSRQDRVKALLPLTLKSSGRQIKLDLRDYNQDIIASKQKAAEYYYQHAITLLQKNNKNAARQAYSEFSQTLGFYADYKDTKQLMQEARAKGTTYVLMGVKNNTKEIIPKALEDELKVLPLGDLNRFWTQYHNNSQSGYSYDYTIVINMKSILLSPEQVKEDNYAETKEIEDGWQYVLDAKGNVMKDSLGNDIKVPKKIKIVAQVKEVHQFKKAGIQGTLDLINNGNGQLLKSEPIMAEQVFENHTATAFGDLRALTPQTKAKLGAPPKPFPPNADMVYQAGLIMKNMCKDIVSRYSSQID